MKRVRTRLFQLVKKREAELGKPITNKEIATQLGISMHTVGSWMKDDVGQLNTRLLLAFCEYLKCDIGDLLYIDRENPAPSP